MAENCATQPASCSDPDGCKHYRRKCEIQAPCCKGWFTCHICHDEQGGQDGNCSEEMKGTAFQMASGGFRSIGRYAVERIRCKDCKTEQDVKESCENCGVRFGGYVCLPCKLFACSKVNIYHCDGCGICRVGQGLGVSHFHCNKCNACYTLESKAEHRCVERALESDCPLCLGLLFTSSEPIYVGVFCGHAMHSSCAQQMFRSGQIKCPTCAKPLLDITKLPAAPSTARGMCTFSCAIGALFVVGYFGYLFSKAESYSRIWDAQSVGLLGYGTGAVCVGFLSYLLSRANVWQAIFRIGRQG